MTLDLSADLGLLIGRATAQGGRMQCAIAAQEHPQVDLGLDPALHADDDEPSAGCEAGDVSLEVFRGHVVEDDVDSATACLSGNDVGEVLLAIVDKHLGPEFLAAGELLRGSRGDRDAGSECACHLDRHGANAAAATVHE